jgi:hypothetical protein
VDPTAAIEDSQCVRSASNIPARPPAGTAGRKREAATGTCWWPAEDTTGFVVLPRRRAGDIG